MSGEIADALILHTYPGLNPFNLGKITQRQYDILLKQSFNLKNFDINGKLEYETEYDKRKRLQLEWKEDIEKILNRKKK